MACTLQRFGEYDMCCKQPCGSATVMHAKICLQRVIRRPNRRSAGFWQHRVHQTSCVTNRLGILKAALKQFMHMLSILEGPLEILHTPDCVHLTIDAHPYCPSCKASKQGCRVLCCTETLSWIRLFCAIRHVRQAQEKYCGSCIVFSRQIIAPYMVYGSPILFTACSACRSSRLGGPDIVCSYYIRVQ